MPETLEVSNQPELLLGAYPSEDPGPLQSRRCRIIIEVAAGEDRGLLSLRFLSLRPVLDAACFGRKPEPACRRQGSGRMVTGHEKKPDSGIVEGLDRVGCR
jgi:hypothetical protein